MKGYLTKYALSTGAIQEIEVEPTSVFKMYKRPGLYSYVYADKDFFIDKEKAIAEANRLRVKKIASLKKQIERLEKLKF